MLTSRKARAVAAALVVAAAGIAFAGTAGAKTARTARIVVQDQWKNLVKSSDGRVMEQFRDSGVVVGEPDDPMNGTWQTCYGTYASSPGGEIRTISAYCDGRDDDGDVYWLAWEGGESDGPWQFTGGTGKFRGISGGGTWRDHRLSGGQGWVVRTVSGRWDLAGP